jgi:hypothetical protein
MDIHSPTLPAVSPQPPGSDIPIPTPSSPPPAASLPEFPIGDLVKRSSRKFKDKEEQLAYEVRCIITRLLLTTITSHLASSTLINIDKLIMKFNTFFALSV